MFLEIHRENVYRKKSLCTESEHDDSEIKGECRFISRQQKEHTGQEDRGTRFDKRALCAHTHTRTRIQYVQYGTLTLRAI